MSTRKRVKRFWGRVEKIFETGDSPAGSTSSLPPTQTTPQPGSPIRARSHSPTPQPSAQGLAARARSYIEASDANDKLSTPQNMYQESRLPAEASDPIKHASNAAVPTSTTADSAWRCFDNCRQVLGGITTGVGPLKAVMDELGEIFGMYEDAAEAQSDYAALKTELEGTFSGLSTHFSGNVPPTMTAGMNNLCAAIESELVQISTKESRRMGRRYLEARKDLDDVMKCYRRIQGHLKRLSLNADLSMWKIVDEQASELRLKSLTPSMSACYNSAEALQVGRRDCTPETRKQVLENLSHWRHDKSQENMYWLNGMAGTGKTTIASTLCTMLDRSHELGASFFCTRLLPECRNVKLILPTIAYQLARFSRPFYHTLSTALQSDPDLHTKALPIQLNGLIIDPLRKAAIALPEDFVVVIDALDECDDSQAIGMLLEILAKSALQLPLKVFVSSRPEPQIREKIAATKTKLVLHELEASIVKGDIKLYLQAELEELSTFITGTELATLVERAGVLFIYAATVVRYIKSVSSSSRRQNRVREVLEVDKPESTRAESDIDTLYSAILTSAFTSPELNIKEAETMKLILDTVICAQEPLMVSALAGLCGLRSQAAVHDALEPLWSVLHISGGDSLVTTLHASFPDYMLDPVRSKQLACRRQEHHGRLAELCFDRIDNNQCQFNICGLESSYLFDEQVSGLQERVDGAIPQDLWYSCRYWAEHLRLGGPSNERSEKIENFLEKRLLLWMEVLNLNKQMSVGSSIIETAESWCKREGTASLKALVHDAWRFVTMFATNDVSRSTPHLYISMQASWPRAGSLTRCYEQRVRGLAKVGGTAMAIRQLALLGAFNADAGVLSVAFSPNGAQIVSGTMDGTVQVWDGRNGKLLFDLKEGHTDWVRSVAFSPDGTHIVSGSDDKKIRVWDAQTGKPLLDPLEGHIYWVMSAVFSPDGMRIASGSGDKTIRVWDAQTGKQLLDPLKAHTNGVTSVSFSPNGSFIVSGSSDKTIRLWDAQKGKPLLNSLEGHTKPVRSVAFSSDGMRIVSGSEDKTIRVWDAPTGKNLLALLDGHSDSVRSVAFSPDGTQIVSGSSDWTIRVWDAQTGKLVLDPIKGHNGSITSVAFSPDGTRVVSGSEDQTIRVWDTQIDTPPINPLNGHYRPVTAVAFSLDGTSIVSGSKDSTVQVWDAQTGKRLLDPLEGHTGSVISAAFSADGVCIASGSTDSTIRVWDAQTGKPLLDPLEGHTQGIYSVAFSANGTRIVSGSDDKTIRLWDARTGKPLLDALNGHTYSVQSVAFSPDGLRIVSGSVDETIRLWDAQTGRPLLDPLKGHTDNVWSVAFSPDGTRIVSGSGDQTIRVWDSQTGNLLLDPFKGHRNWVMSVAFLSDGKRIISSSYDKTIRVWDAQTGEALFEPLRGHADWLNAVAFSPDGTRAVSGSTDAAIRMWDLEQLVPLSKSNVQISDSISSLSSWHLGENGWVLDEQKRPLLWLPPDIRDRVLLPQMLFLISTEGFVTLDFSEAKLGESWTECYVPSI